MKNKKKKLLVVATLFSFLILASTLNFNFCCYAMIHREINSNNNELNNNLNNLNNRDRRKQLDKAIQENDISIKHIDMANKCIDKYYGDIIKNNSGFKNIRIDFELQLEKIRGKKTSDEELHEFWMRDNYPWKEQEQSCCSCLLI